MLELLLCSSLTILPDFLYRRFAQGKRIGQEITFFSVWYELRWGITFCVILTVSLITTIFYFHPSTNSAVSVFRTVTILPERNGRVATKEFFPSSMPQMEWILVMSIASSNVIGGMMVPIRLESIDLPEPGGPIIKMLWPPATATSMARFACCWPLTSEKSES